MSIDFYKESLATYEEYEIESEILHEFNRHLPANLMVVKQLLCLIY